jgi:iron complex outermembrane receptor protein
MVPRHKASAALDWDAGSAGRYSAVLDAVGARPYGGDFTNTHGELAGYATLDFAAHWRAARWNLSARLLNALDKRYAASAGYASYLPAPSLYFYPADGRAFFVSAGHDFR